jgi:hypothetical protein
MQSIIMWALGVYIALECFVSFYKMHHGDKFCRLAKYGFALATGLLGVALHYALSGHAVVWLWLVPNLAVALFLWPTTNARFTGGFKNRIGD